MGKLSPKKTLSVKLRPKQEQKTIMSGHGQTRVHGLHHGTLDQQLVRTKEHLRIERDRNRQDQIEMVEFLMDQVRRLDLLHNDEEKDASIAAKKSLVEKFIEMSRPDTAFNQHARFRCLRDHTEQGSLNQLLGMGFPATKNSLLDLWVRCCGDAVILDEDGTSSRMKWHMTQLLLVDHAEAPSLWDVLHLLFSRLTARPQQTQNTMYTQQLFKCLHEAIQEITPHALIEEEVEGEEGDHELPIRVALSFLEEWREGTNWILLKRITEKDAKVDTFVTKIARCMALCFDKEPNTMSAQALCAILQHVWNHEQRKHWSRKQKKAFYNMLDMQVTRLAKVHASDENVLSNMMTEVLKCRDARRKPLNVVEDEEDVLNSDVEEEDETFWRRQPQIPDTRWVQCLLRYMRPDALRSHWTQEWLAWICSWRSFAVLRTLPVHLIQHWQRTWFILCSWINSVKPSVPLTDAEQEDVRRLMQSIDGVSEELLAHASETIKLMLWLEHLSGKPIDVEESLEIISDFIIWDKTIFPDSSAKEDSDFDTPQKTRAVFKRRDQEVCELLRFLIDKRLQQASAAGDHELKLLPADVHLAHTLVSNVRHASILNEMLNLVQSGFVHPAAFQHLEDVETLIDHDGEDEQHKYRNLLAWIRLLNDKDAGKREQQDALYQVILDTGNDELSRDVIVFEHARPANGWRGMWEDPWRLVTPSTEDIGEEEG
jgi:hypothetical protein